jgi:DNA-binding transcriptional LysR family regulator
VRNLIPDVRHLQTFSAVARCGSFSAAARELHLSQPALTQAVADFERSLGARLLERSSRGVALTEPGRRALLRVERALAYLQEAFADAARSAKLERRLPLRAATVSRLAAVVEVTEAGGFANAARSSGVARTTVHRAARQLERVLGAVLFEETSHGVRGTREAERLARRIRLAGAEIEQARAEVAATQGNERGETVIGVMPLASSALVPAAVLAFASYKPRHSIRLLDGPYETLLHALRVGRADFLLGALRSSVPSDVMQEHLFDDPLAIIVRAEHPLARDARDAPDLRSLSRFAWIAPRVDSPLRRQFDLLMAKLPGSARSAPVECNSLVAARAMLLASDRVMLLSAQQVVQELTSGHLAALPHPLGRVVRPIGFTVRRGWLPTEAQRALLGEIREQVNVRGGEPSTAVGTRNAI